MFVPMVLVLSVIVHHLFKFVLFCSVILVWCIF